MINVFLLCGGPSSEHEISLRSALNISQSLNKDKYSTQLVYIDKKGSFSKPFELIETKDEFDLVKETNENVAGSIAEFLQVLKNYDPNDTIIIPAIHGTYGEDGTIQGLLDCIRFPYIGNGLLSSALCMDKVTTNDIFEKNGLSQAKYLYTYKEGFDDDFIKRCISEIGLPLIVKPSANGSSVGVSKVESEDELKEAIEEALKYDKKALVEELIDGQEIEIAIIGDADNLDASSPAAYITNHKFLDYDAKYFDTETIAQIPYEIEEIYKDKAIDFAKECYKAAGCEGFARVDIFYTKDNKFFINEINTFPGFTPTSFFARLAMDMYDESFDFVLDKLIDDGFRRFEWLKEL